MIHVFVINSISSDVDFGKKLRSHLESRNDIKYFVFNTTHQNMEAEIVKKMIRLFEGERIRFYSCGGSGTFRNIMEGAVAYNQAEFAFLPLGKTNDFVKTFGDDFKLFKDVDNLIDGHVEQIDYIKTNYGCAINSVSFGIDTTLSETLDKVQVYDIFGAKVPFFIAYAKALFGAKPRHVIYKADDSSVDAKITELIVGNGEYLGGGMHFTDKADILDGKLDYLLALNLYGVGILKVISYMVKDNIEEVRNNSVNGKCSKFQIKSVDGSELALNLDGEVVLGGSEWQIEVVNKGLDFVVPKGVVLK